MPFEPVRQIRGRTIIAPQDNIDTDQIIPARFLTTTAREGLGRAAFHDWRFDAEGRPLADSVFAGVRPGESYVLVAGANFGCGSSREHAPWALLDMGVKAVLTTRLADIFRSNALKNGLVAIEVDDELHRFLLEHPGVEVTVDLEKKMVGTHNGGLSGGFDVEPFARRCLLDGVDQLGHILRHAPEIERYERNAA
ncbi:MAG: 3-isopropylmalate dehydratase small subunit [Parvularculaceae bacterium]|nr:3-isopropylmalate dehydratase small subunit [Parvularculaceae bacterium]